MVCSFQPIGVWRRAANRMTRGLEICRGDGEGATLGGGRLSMTPVLSHGELSDDCRLRSRRAAAADRDLLADPRIHLRLDPAHGARTQLDGFGEAPGGHPHNRSCSAPAPCGPPPWASAERVRVRPCPVPPLSSSLRLSLLSGMNPGAGRSGSNRDPRARLGRRPP